MLISRSEFWAVLLRLSMGWFMFFAGIEKVLDPSWSAKGFLLGAKTFPEFYAWLASPANIWWIDPLNAWGITLIGVALLAGVGVRVASLGGVAMMILYYFPHVSLPWVPHGFIVEEHIIYAAAFGLLATLPAAQYFSLSQIARRTVLGRIPLLRALL